MASAPDSLIELSHSQDREGKYKHFWTGRRDWTVSKAEVDAAEDYLWEENWTANEHVMRPLRVRVVADDPSNPGNSRLIVRYKTNYNPSVHPLGKATLSVGSKSNWVKRLKDDSSPALVIESEPDVNGYFFKPVAGSNLVLTPNTALRVNTAYVQGAIEWATFLGLVGKSNDSILTNIGNAAVDTLLLAGAGIPEFFLYNSDSETVPFFYELWYDPRGWSGTILVGRFRRRLKSQPVLWETDEDNTAWMDIDGNEVASGNGVPATAKRRVVSVTEQVDLPGGDDGTRILVTKADFSALWGFLTWV